MVERQVVIVIMSNEKCLKAVYTKRGDLKELLEKKFVVQQTTHGIAQTHDVSYDVYS